MDVFKLQPLLDMADFFFTFFQIRVNAVLSTAVQTQMLQIYYDGVKKYLSDEDIFSTAPYGDIAGKPYLLPTMVYK